MLSVMGPQNKVQATRLLQEVLSIAKHICCSNSMFFDYRLHLDNSDETNSVLLMDLEKQYNSSPRREPTTHDVQFLSKLCCSLKMRIFVATAFCLLLLFFVGSRVSADPQAPSTVSLDAAAPNFQGASVGYATS